MKTLSRSILQIVLLCAFTSQVLSAAEGEAPDTSAEKFEFGRLPELPFAPSSEPFIYDRLGGLPSQPLSTKLIAGLSPVGSHGSYQAGPGTNLKPTITESSRGLAEAISQQFGQIRNLISPVLFPEVMNTAELLSKSVTASDVLPENIDDAAAKLNMTRNTILTFLAFQLAADMKIALVNEQRVAFPELIFARIFNAFGPLVTEKFAGMITNGYAFVQLADMTAGYGDVSFPSLRTHLQDILNHRAESIKELELTSRPTNETWVDEILPYFNLTDETKIREAKSFLEIIVARVTRNLTANVDFQALQKNFEGTNVELYAMNTAVLTLYVGREIEAIDAGREFSLAGFFISLANDYVIKGLSLQNSVSSYYALDLARQRYMDSEDIRQFYLKREKGRNDLLTMIRGSLTDTASMATEDSVAYLYYLRASITSVRKDLKLGYAPDISNRVLSKYQIAAKGARRQSFTVPALITGFLAYGLYGLRSTEFVHTVLHNTPLLLPLGIALVGTTARFFAGQKAKEAMRVAVETEKLLGDVRALNERIPPRRIAPRDFVRAFVEKTMKTECRVF